MEQTGDTALSKNLSANVPVSFSAVSVTSCEGDGSSPGSSATVGLLHFVARGRWLNSGGAPVMARPMPRAAQTVSVSSR
jgi:hypothetical protein